jgi:hypothetical protein
VTRRQTLSPVSEIMPDRCTPEYERVVAKMGASLPYRRARTPLSEFLPLDDIPPVEMARQRTIRVGARLEKEAVTSAKAAEPTSVEAKSIALSIDGGHVRSVRHYQVRSFEVLLAQVTNDDGKQTVFNSVPAGAIDNRISCAAFFINWARQPSLRSRFSAMGRKVRARSAKRPVQPLVAGFSAARILGPPRNWGQATIAVGGDTSFTNRLSPKFGGTRQPIPSRPRGIRGIRRSILTPALTPAPAEL